MKQKATKKKALARPFVMTVAAVGIPSALVAAGCGTSKPGATAGDGIAPQPTLGGDDGTCTTEGAQRACHKTVGQNGPYIACFEGTQTCAGGLWSECGGTGSITSYVGQLPLKPAATPGGGSIHPLGGGPTCGDGVCSGGTCNGGSNDDKKCLVPTDCPGGMCVIGKCQGGPKNGNDCYAASDCSGFTCKLTTESCATCPTDCGLCAPGGADAGAAICASDPCATGCLGWTTSSPLTVGTGTTSVIGVTGFGQIKFGQLKKLLNDACNGGSICDSYAGFGPSSFYNCQLDTYCSLKQLGGDGCCHQFAPSGVQGTDVTDMGTVAGIDITIGPGCSDNESDKYRYFPVCNRGSTAVPPSTVIRAKYTTPVQPFSPCPAAGDPGYCTAATADCSVTTDAVTGLLPGTCMLMDTQAAGCSGQPSGDKWIYINCDGNVAEGTMSALATAQAAPDSEPASSLGCANNWTDHSPDNNPPSCSTTGAGVTNYTLQYKATCPPGYKVQWRELQYSSSCPKNGSGTSEAIFSAGTAPDVSGAPGPFTQPITLAEARNNAASPASDPEICTTTPTTFATCTNADTAGVAKPGPTPPCCPKDILAQFQRPTTSSPFPGYGILPGQSNDENPWLQLNIQLKTTPDGKNAPTVNSFQLSYQCVSNE